MVSRPALKRYLTVVPSESGWLCQGGESELVRLRADAKHQKLFDFLLSHLDGRRTVDEIVDASKAEAIPAESVRRMIEKLAERGLLEEGGDGALTSAETSHFQNQLLYFGRFAGQENGAMLQAKLKSSVADVLALGPLGSAVARQLQELGVGRLRLFGDDDAQLSNLARGLQAARGSAPLTKLEVTALSAGKIADRDFDPTSLLIVALESWDPAFIEDVNARAIETKRPWLLLQSPGVKEGTVGPLFVPPTTACYACLESRLLSHMSFHAEYREFRHHLLATSTRSRPWGSLMPNVEILAGFAALEAAKFITGFATPVLLGAFVTIDWFEMKMRNHHVLRVPRCLACRPPHVQKFPWERALLEPLDEEP